MPGHDDFEYALREIGSFIDISEEDLTRIYELAHKHARELAMRYRKLAVAARSATTRTMRNGRCDK